jgi:prepilin-type N-terminal cleavage/methylation domain-containing protein
MERLRSESGLTLMELIIVLAVIVIISSIIAPNLIAATDKAKLKSDIQSAAVLQSAIELYNAEHPNGFGNVGGQIHAVDGVANVIIVKSLSDDNYLSKAATTPQTEKLRWIYNANDKLVKVNIEECAENIKEIAKKLGESERSWFYPSISADPTE